MSRLMLALGLGALAGASAFERAAPTFELRAATVPKVGSLAAAPGGPLCNICEQLADQALQQLLNIAVQGGVIGSCAKLCGLLNTQWEATACNLVCDAVGIEAFVKAIGHADLDPIYYCHIVDLCKEFDDASATVTQLAVNPASGSQFTFTADINVNSTVGAGEVALQFYDSTGANVGGGATTTSGADVGEFTTSLAYDNTQTDEPLPAGDYTATFYFCQGECGSSHPISKILGSASTTFTIADAGGVLKMVTEPESN